MKTGEMICTICGSASPIQDITESDILKRTPNYKPKSCDMCGEFFKPAYSNQRYCSEKCLKKHISEVGKKRYYKKYVKKGNNREMVCKICGNTYIGHYNSRYCIECLKNSKYHIKRYLYNRIDYDGE